MPERKCLECGEPLRGRADQKYCSDQCRNSYHNKLMADSNNTVRKINRVLRKNQIILTSLNTTGKTTVPVAELTRKGFNFNYFTNLYTTRNGRRYFFCYDQGYALVDSDMAILVMKQDYVD